MPLRSGQPSEVMQYLQNRLQRHFAELFAVRRSLLDGAPVFVLEHDLTEDERAALSDEVIASVQGGLLSSGAAA